MPQGAESGSVQTGHIGINVGDIGRSRDFYRRVFGFEVMTESYESGREFVFLGYDGRLVLTLWQQASGRFDSGRPGLHHLSFHVPTADDVRNAEARLRQMNVRMVYEGIVPHADGAASGGIYFEDPDGIRLEIYAPDAGLHGHGPTPGAPSCGFF